jgi:hypothetical protein
MHVLMYVCAVYVCIYVRCVCVCMYSLMLQVKSSLSNLTDKVQLLDRLLLDESDRQE